MSRPFRRTRSGVRVQLDPAERTLLVRLLDDVEELLAEDAADRGGSAESGSAEPGSAAPRSDDGPRSDDEVLAALEASLTPPPPEDPAVARLLPDGNREDADLAAGFRRLTEDTLRRRKRDTLGLASSALGRPEPVLLDDGEALALLKGLTDVRLVLAERLGMRTDEDAESLHALVATGPADPRAAAAALYDALTWWQESLVAVIR